MIAWLRDFVRTGSDVVTSRADLAEGRLRQLAPMLVALVMIGCVGGAAIGGMLGGAVLLLAAHIGLGAALLLMSTVTVIATTIVLAVSYRRTSASVQASAAQFDAAREHLHELIAPKAAPETGHAEATGNAASPDRLHQAIDTIASNPTLIASGAFAAISVLGARRTVWIVRAASALATVRAVASQIGPSPNDVSRNGHPSSEHPTAAPHTRHNRVPSH